MPDQSFLDEATQPADDSTAEAVSVAPPMTADEQVAATDAARISYRLEQLHMLLGLIGHVDWLAARAIIAPNSLFTLNELTRLLAYARQGGELGGIATDLWRVWTGEPCSEEAAQVIVAALRKNFPPPEGLKANS